MNFVNRIRIIVGLLAMVVMPLASQAQDQVDSAPASEQRDRLDLDATSVTGNQELPRVLYILPWKESAIGDLQGKPVNSLLDEVLAPLDREVFQRQVRYFDQLHAADSSSATDKD